MPRRKKRGEKLTESNVKEIKALIQKGVPGSALAVKYGVSRQLITDIKHERCWADIPWPKEEMSFETMQNLMQE